MSNPTTLPDALVTELKKNIRAGAADLEQQWSSAIELTVQAYRVAGVKIPTPLNAALWTTYIDMLKYSVSQLSKHRGIDGDWRLTTHHTKPRHITETTQPTQPKRVFAYINNEPPTEVSSPDLDHALTQVTKQLLKQQTEPTITNQTAEEIVLSLTSHGKNVGKITLKTF